MGQVPVPNPESNGRLGAAGEVSTLRLWRGKGPLVPGPLVAEHQKHFLNERSTRKNGSYRPGQGAGSPQPAAEAGVY